MSSGIDTPAGYVRCALCFDLVRPEFLHRCDDGQLEDVCLPCVAREREQLARLASHQPGCGCLTCCPRGAL